MTTTQILGVAAIIGLIASGFAYMLWEERRKRSAAQPLPLIEELEALAEEATRERIRHEDDAEYHDFQAKYWGQRRARLLKEAEIQKSRATQSGEAV